MKEQRDNKIKKRKKVLLFVRGSNWWTVWSWYDAVSSIRYLCSLYSSLWEYRSQCFATMNTTWIPLLGTVDTFVASLCKHWRRKKVSSLRSEDRHPSWRNLSLEKLWWNSSILLVTHWYRLWSLIISILVGRRTDVSDFHRLFHHRSLVKEATPTTSSLERELCCVHDGRNGTNERS